MSVDVPLMIQGTTFPYNKSHHHASERQLCMKEKSTLLGVMTAASVTEEQRDRCVTYIIYSTVSSVHIKQG